MKNKYTKISQEFFGSGFIIHAKSGYKVSMVDFALILESLNESKFKDFKENSSIANDIYNLLGC